MAIFRRKLSDSVTPLKCLTAGQMKSSKNTADSALITDDTELKINTYTCVHFFKNFSDSFILDTATQASLQHGCQYNAVLRKYQYNVLFMNLSDEASEVVSLFLINNRCQQRRMPSC